MSKVWKVAEACLTKLGWHRASKKLEKSLNKLYNLIGTEGLEKYFLGRFLTIYTHPRCGEFSSMVEAETLRVKLFAKKRRVVWIKDENEEWCKVLLFFGTDQALMKIAEDTLHKLSEEKKNNEFKDSMTVEELESFAKRFGGTRKEFGSIWYERNDDWVLSFTGVANAKDIYKEGKQVSAIKYVGRSKGEFGDPIEHHYFNYKHEIEEFINNLEKDKE